MMVRMLNSGEIRPESLMALRATKIAAAKMEGVKMEMEDHLEEEHGPFSKKFKLAAPPLMCGAGGALVSQESVPCNLFSEPSPLGLRLKKTSSLLDLIQMRLSQVNSAAATCDINSETLEGGKRKELKSIAGSTAADKMKASNFPASLLMIGTWEYISRYEGDLVAKCYYAKHKLVWEVLESGLKSKIEIQWSDIAAIKATCPENESSTLDIVLVRPPLFFRETNPQPRKHTLWQATADFTGGQASVCRRHILQCPLGILNKHFEKLIQCDPRLNSLSQEREISIESPYFEPRCSVFDDQSDSKCHVFDSFKDDFNSTFSEFHEIGSSPDTPLTFVKNKSREPTADSAARETSPISVMDSPVNVDNTITEAEELKDDRHQDQHKVSGLKSSMSMRDLADHLEHCVSEKKNSGNSADGLPSKDMLEEISQYLLSDNQVLSASDELLIMSKVNSFCSLLQKDVTTVPNYPMSNDPEDQDEDEDEDEDEDDEDEPQLMMPGLTSEMNPVLDIPTTDADRTNSSPCKQPNLSRKESFGDLLVHLPRIASLPKFLFDISEQSDSQAR